MTTYATDMVAESVLALQEAIGRWGPDDLSLDDLQRVIRLVESRASESRDACASLLEFMANGVDDDDARLATTKMLRLLQTTDDMITLALRFVQKRRRGAQEVGPDAFRRLESLRAQVGNLADEVRTLQELVNSPS